MVVSHSPPHPAASRVHVLIVVVNHPTRRVIPCRVLSNYGGIVTPKYVEQKKAAPK